MSRYAHLAYTPSVRTVQHELGSGPAADRRLREPAGNPTLTAMEVGFLQGLDGFLLGTVSETGWPYIQYRGGPPGFLQALDETTLAFCDVRGNRQYITMGNLRAENRVSLFCIDYARRTRLKIFGRATSVPAAEAPDLVERLAATRTDGRVEHVMTIDVEGFDWNCPKHITPRFTERELAPLGERLRQLEAENAALRAQLAASRPD